jgi:hypothetical protein
MYYNLILCAERNELKTIARGRREETQDGVMAQGVKQGDAAFRHEVVVMRRGCV